MNNPGRYDEWCTAIRAIEAAEAVIVIVLGGRRGHGFAVQSPHEAMHEMPKVLREIATQMEVEMAQAPVNAPTVAANDEPLPNHQTPEIGEPGTESVAVDGIAPEPPL